MAVMRPHTAKNIVHIAANPTFMFTQEALFKIQCLVEETDKEVGWLGRVVKTDTGFICNEVFLPHQEVAAATCEITADGIAKLLDEIGFEENETLRLWGHSHVNMGVSPSGQDQDQMKLFRDNGCEWFFRIICNKKGEIGVTFFDWSKNYYVEDMQWGIAEAEEDSARRAAIKSEMDEKVKPLVYNTWNNGWGQGKVWDYTQRCYVWPDDKKKEGEAGTTQAALTLVTTTSDTTKTSGDSDGQDSSCKPIISYAVAQQVYMDTPLWLVSMINSYESQETAIDVARFLRMPAVLSVMHKYKINITQFLYAITHIEDLEREALGTVEDYILRCRQALDSLSNNDKMALANFPKTFAEDGGILAVCQQYNIEYDDLADTAFEWLNEEEERKLV